MEGHRVVILQFVRVVGGGDGLGGHFSASDSVDDFELLISELDILEIELVSDGSPPVFIFGLLDELLNFISSFFLNYFFKVVVISEVLELVVPAIGHFANFDFNLLIELII